MSPVHIEEHAQSCIYLLISSNSLVRSLAVFIAMDSTAPYDNEREDNQSKQPEARSWIVRKDYAYTYTSTSTLKP